MATQHPQRILDSHADLDAQIGALNAQAKRCRRLAEATFNREVNEMLGTMAEGYERTAGELSKKRFG